jgi:hypothetical protein
MNEKNDIEQELQKAIKAQNKYDVQEYSTQLKELNKDVSRLKDISKEKNKNEISNIHKAMKNINDEIIIARKTNNYNKLIELEKQKIEENERIINLYQNMYRSIIEEKEVIIENIDKLKQEQILEKKRENRIKLTVIADKLKELRERYHEIEAQIEKLFYNQSTELKSDIRNLNATIEKYKLAGIVKKTKEVLELLDEKKTEYISLKKREIAHIEDKIKNLNSHFETVQKQPNNIKKAERVEKKLNKGMIITFVILSYL